jgi:hypothetical protein
MRDSSVIAAEKRRTDMIRKGDIITILPQFRDAGDESFTWVARNDEENGRVDISALELSHLPLWPMQTVTIDMLSPVAMA